MAFTYGTVKKCKTADGSASSIYEVRFGYELVELGTSSQNPPVSTIKLQLEVRSTSSSYKPYGYTQTTTIDGTSLGSKTFDLRSTNSWQVWGTRTVTVNHNNDGTYSAEKSGSFTTNCSGARPKSGTASVTVTLPTVPRYTSITSFTVSKRNETSLTFNWQTADTIDYVWYSTNNGSSWTGYDVTDGTSGSFTVSSLSPNTTYQCKLRVRRKDSQLTTDSSAVSATTYQAPSQSFKSKTETSITMNWSCDSNADYIWYSRDNGSNWTAVGSVSGTSGSYTISSLSANTSYNIKTRVRRSATQTTYDTSASSQKTYQYPYVSGVGSANLTIGNSQTLTLYNPLGRSCTVYMKKDSSSGTQLYSGSTSGTSITFTPTASTLYSSIPNAKYGNCVYYCTYSSQTVSVSSGNTYIVNESVNAPTLSSSSLTDTNSTTTALTGSSSKIVLNASTLLISVTASPKNSATISTIKIDGSSRTVSNNTATLSITKPTKSSYTVVITDSRGISTQTSVSIASGNVINYIPLTIVGVANRNQPTDGKVNISSSGKYFNGSFGSQSNTLTTSYTWRESGGSWQSWTSLSNTTSTGTHSEAQIQLTGFDYTKSYEFQFKAVDKLNTVTSTVYVTKGTPIFNWDNDEFDTNVNTNLRGNVVVNHIASKNLLKNTASTKTESGVTWTVNNDGTISLSGTASAYTGFEIGSASVNASMGTVVVSGLSTATNIVWDSITLYDTSGTSLATIGAGASSNQIIDLSNYSTVAKIKVIAKRHNNTSTSGIIKPQIEIGSVVTGYTPYQGLLDENNIKNKKIIVGGISGKNLFNINGEINVQGNNGNIVSGNSSSNNILTTNVNGATSYGVGQKFTNLNGKTFTVSAKCVSNGTGIGCYLAIYDNNAQITYKIITNGNTNSITYTGTSNNIVIGFSTVNGTGAQVTNIQVEVGSSVTDYVEFQGVGYVSGQNSNGNYIKYDDGTLICYNREEFTGQNFTAAGSLYRCDISNPFTFPMAFVSAPVVFVQPQEYSDYTFAFTYAIRRSYTAITLIELMRVASASNVSVPINYVAIGRWK